MGGELRVEIEKRHRVLIICRSHLFCKGLQSVLRSNDGLEVMVATPTSGTAIEQVKSLAVGTVIIDGDDPEQDRILTQILGDGSNIKVMLVSLSNNRLEIITRRSVVDAGKKDLLAAILSGNE